MANALAQNALSQVDIDNLLADPSARTRIEVARNLGRDIEGSLLTEAEVRAAQELIRIMARDVEVTVRAALSNSLRHAKRLPHDVALAMANDVEAVAVPILADSLVLTNSDLIDVVRGGSPTRQTAIATRKSVSEPVAAALIAQGGELTVCTLLGNPGAHITDEGLNAALDRFAQSDAVKEEMAHRPSLPITITERLVAMVSEKLQDYLVAHHKLPASLATDMALRSRERATLHFSASLGGEHVADLVAQMHANHRLTPTLMLRALCIGDITFFEFGIAALAAIPVANARILIHDAGEKGFAALYFKSGLPNSLYHLFRAATRVIDGTTYDGGERDKERFSSRVISRVLTTIDDVPSEDLDYLLERLGDVTAPA
jgi:uncharacterized protein (DUF2336 family)